MRLALADGGPVEAHSHRDIVPDKYVAPRVGDEGSVCLQRVLDPPSHPQGLEHLQQLDQMTTSGSQRLAAVPHDLDGSDL